MKDMEIQAIVQPPKVDSTLPPNVSGVKKKDQAPVSSSEAAFRNSDMSSLVAQVDEFVRRLSTKVSFSTDSKTGKQVIIVSENSTGKIIRQIPPQEMLELVAKMKEISGIIFSGKI